MSNYYHSEGAAKRLIAKFGRIKELDQEIAMLRVNLRFEDEKEALASRILQLQQERRNLSRKVV